MPIRLEKETQKYLVGSIKRFFAVLGSGEKLFSDIDMLSLGYQCVEHMASPNPTHVVFKKTR